MHPVLWPSLELSGYPICLYSYFKEALPCNTNCANTTNPLSAACPSGCAASGFGADVLKQRAAATPEHPVSGLARPACSAPVSGRWRRFFCPVRPKKFEPAGLQQGQGGSPLVEHERHLAGRHIHHCLRCALVGMWRSGTLIGSANNSPARWVGVPAPEAAKLRRMASVLSSAISSARLLMPSLGSTSSKLGGSATRATGSKSFTGSSPKWGGPTGHAWHRAGDEPGLRPIWWLGVGRGAARRGEQRAQQGDERPRRATAKQPGRARLGMQGR